MKTKIGLLVKKQISYQNISQITTSPGLIVICEIDIFSIFSADFFLFQGLGHKAVPLKTKIGLLVKKQISYQNIPQITTSPGLIVICEIDIFSIFSADFFLFQVLGDEAAPLKTKIGFQIGNKICYRNISQITTSPGLIAICEIDILLHIFSRFLLISRPRTQSSTF